jgi:hypothetical protein
MTAVLTDMLVGESTEKLPANPRTTMASCIDTSLLDADPNTAPQFFLQIRLAYIGEETIEIEEDNVVHRVNFPHWLFAVWTFPLEVNVCKPVMMQIKKTLMLQDWVPRWSRVGNVDAHSFWQELRELRSKEHAHTVKRKKKTRRAELLTGAAGPLHGSWITGEVLLRGGMSGTVLQFYGKATWMKASGASPAGVVKIDRLVEPPRLKVGFVPLGKEGPHQSQDGWWFATEAEAIAANQIFQTGTLKTPTNASKRRSGDDSCAGNDAREDPGVIQDPVFVLPAHVLSTWGMNPHDGTSRSRCKPPVSAKGLVPLALPTTSFSGTRVLPGCPVQLHCCGSLERNIPAQLQSAAFAISMAMPDRCPTPAELAPCSRTHQSGIRANIETEDIAEDTDGVPDTIDVKEPTLAPSFTRPVTPPTNAAGWAKAKLVAERAEGAKIWTSSDENGGFEIVSPETVGLPMPSPESMKSWWRSMGIL